MQRYTFFVEKQGATLIEQVLAPSLQSAVAEWHSFSEAKPGPVDPDERITPVQDTEAVWCFSGIDSEGVFFLVHVVGP